MKQKRILLLSLFLINNLFSQKLDTLKVIVLSPNKIEVTDDFSSEYQKIQSEILKKRRELKEQKLKEKEDNLEAFNNQPDYTKIMFINELNFFDSLTIDNFISMITREYIAYRLYKPYKIKPRLVLVNSKNTPSDLKQYNTICQGYQNHFIINFPSLKFYKENGTPRVQTRIELYSNKTKEILLSKELIGIPKAGLTDYPMCSGDNLDCAIVNSVYPNLIEILMLISENNNDGR